MSTSPSTQTLNLLHSLLKRGEQTATELMQLLKQQQELLKARQYPQLSALLEPQQQLVETIATIEQQLKSVLVQHQCAFTRQGVEEFIESTEPNIRRLLAQAWQVFTATLTRCHQQIKTQERIFHRNQQSVRTLLSLLKGQTTPAAALYQANGQTQSLKSTQWLAQA